MFFNDDVMDDSNFENEMRKLTGAKKTRRYLQALLLKNTLPSSWEILKPKNDAASLEARNIGNDFYTKYKNCVAALEHYNRSICLAPKDSKNLAIGYANRSLVYLKCGFYKYCLQNIDLALANNYPEKFKPKLVQRKEECVELMKHHEDGLEKFNKHKSEVMLSYPANDRMPIVIDDLEYVPDSDKFGRHIRTKRDLYPGDVIICEKPFSKCVEVQYEYKYCANCLKQNHLNLLPCQYCTRAMFCTEDCRQEAWKRFHKYECKIIDGLFSPHLSPIIVGIRTTLKAFTMFDDAEELEELIYGIDVEKESAYDLDYTRLTEKDHFRAIYAHSGKDYVPSFTCLKKFCRFSAVAWHLLSRNTAISQILYTEELEDLFLNLLYRFIVTAGIYCHSIQTGIVTKSETFGAGLFALTGLINHSCAPNITRMTVDTKNVIIVERVIRAGEQIFDNYGPHHLFSDFNDRQEMLKLRYNFICDCEACTGNYGLMTPCLTSIFNMDRECIRSYDIEFTKNQLKEYKKYLKKKNKKYPRAEFVDVQSKMQLCFNVLYLDMPLERYLKPID